MHNYSLDDLIIDTPAQHKKNKKGPILAIGLILILLILVVFISKVILGPSANEIEDNKTNSTKLEKAELIKVKEEQSSEDRLDIIINNKLLDRPITTKDKPKSQKPIVADKQDKKTEPKATEIENTNTETKAEKPKAESTEEKVQVEKPKAEKPKVEKTKKPKAEKPKIEKKKVEESVKKAKPSELFAGDKKEYYVQVGAFNKDPSQKYLDKIKDGGFEYVIHTNDRTRRVRVGPYDSRDNAKDALKDINSTLGIQGFVIRRKL